MRMFLSVFLLAAMLLAVCGCGRNAAVQMGSTYITESRVTIGGQSFASAATEAGGDESRDMSVAGSSSSRAALSSGTGHTAQSRVSDTVTRPGQTVSSLPSGAGSSSSKAATTSSVSSKPTEPELPPASKTVVYHDVQKQTSLKYYFDRHSADEVLTYKKVGNTPISLGIYYPKGYQKGKKYPLFVFVHGGGWGSHKIFSDQNGKWAGDYLGFLARYYAEKGYISVSIDYRLMQQNGQIDGYGIIDLYEDCFDAVQYLQTNQDKYGMDFSNSVVLGESAGGHLAAALSTFSYKGKPVFKKAILVNAITDLSDLSWSKVVPKNTNNAHLKNLTYAQRTKFLSPIDHIDATTCSTLLIHGTADTVVDPNKHSVAYNDKMFANGRNSELHLINDINHAFLLAEYMVERKLLYAAANTSIGIIDQWLGV